MQLSLSLLGPFEAAWTDQPIAFATNAARALLAYLAVEADRAHQRELLATMLWPGKPQAAAYANLRQTLARVRKAIPERPAFPAALDVTRQTLRFKSAAAALDVTRFQRLLAECAAHAHSDVAGCPACVQRLHQAAALYRGEFLHGLFVARSQPFEEWALLKRATLHRQALKAMNALTRAHQAAADYPQMHRYAARQLALEPWSEDAHAQMMRALAASGERSAALAQYETCRQVLDAELGVAPSTELTALYEQLRNGPLPARRPSPHPVTLSPRQRLGDVPEPGRLWGRTEEAARLRQWLIQDRCQLVTVLGMGGVGKTTLAAAVVRAVTARFDVVLWRSLLSAPPLERVLTAFLSAVSGQDPASVPSHLDDQLELLAEHLRRRRCLLVLDDLERVLSPQQAGAYRPGLESYGQLVQRVVERPHGSCLLVASREQPSQPTGPQADPSWPHSLRLTGLDCAAGRSLLAARGLPGQRAHASALVERFSGNPLALGLVAQTVQELFAGDIGAFLAAQAPIFDGVRTMLDQQHARLSSLEREILAWLAIEGRPVTIPALRTRLVDPGSPRDLVEALRALQRRSLLEQVKGALTSPQVIMRYVIDLLVETACHEIEGGRLELLHRHALLQAQAAKPIRQRQTVLILRPIADRLLARHARTDLPAHLRRLRAALRETAPHLPGYAENNLGILLQYLGERQY